MVLLFQYTVDNTELEKVTRPLVLPQLLVRVRVCVCMCVCGVQAQVGFFDVANTYNSAISHIYMLYRTSTIISKTKFGS